MVKITEIYNLLLKYSQKLQSEFFYYDNVSKISLYTDIISDLLSQTSNAFTKSKQFKEFAENIEKAKSKMHKIEFKYQSTKDHLNSAFESITIINL